MKNPARLQHKMLAMNEALVLGSVRQHELTEAAENLNVRLQLEIAGRKQVEARLRQNEALFSLLIKQAPVGVHVVDSKFCLKQVNPHGMPLFKKVHPLIGRDFSEIVHAIWPKGAADKVVNRFRQTLKTGKSYQAPLFAERRRDIGVREFYEWQIKRVTLPDGEHGVICFFADVTKRKQAEDSQRRLDILTASNSKLEQEIVEREKVEKSLKRSEQYQRQLLERSQQMQKKLRHLSQGILQAQEDERKRISRELHDVIAQTLTGINIQLESLNRAAVDPPSLVRNIRRTQELVKKSVDIVHQFARELRPAALDDLGLIPALHSFAKLFSKRTRIPVHLKAVLEVEKLDIAKRTVLYRVAQEALINVSRHAKASRVEVSIQKQPGGICMKINDDGRSFQVEHVLNNKGRKRLGLLGMSERLEMVGGSFTVESFPGKGTTVIAQIPLDKTAGGVHTPQKLKFKS